MENMSIYTKQDKIEHGEKYALVNIGGIAAGYLTSEFKISSSSNYETLMDFGAGKFKNIETAMKLAGAPIFKSTEFMQRFYMGGNYLQFPIEFKILDENGGNLVKQAAKGLVARTLPEKLDLNKAVADTGNAAVKLLGNSVTAVVDTASEITLSPAGAAMAPLNLATKQIKAVSKSAVNAQIAAGVGPIYCSIGDMLSGWFLLTQVDCVYSKERVATADGGSCPLYGIFSVTLESPSVPNRTFKGAGGDITINTSTNPRVQEK